jgi:hypothetical protein
MEHSGMYKYICIAFNIKGNYGITAEDLKGIFFAFDFESTTPKQFFPFVFLNLALAALRMSTHFALFGCSLVFMCFHVLLVVYYSSRNFFFCFFLLKLYNLQKHENAKLRPKSA